MKPSNRRFYVRSNAYHSDFNVSIRLFIVNALKMKIIGLLSENYLVSALLQDCFSY